MWFNSANLVAFEVLIDYSGFCLNEKLNFPKPKIDLIKYDKTRAPGVVEMWELNKSIRILVFFID